MEFLFEKFTAFEHKLRYEKFYSKCTLKAYQNDISHFINYCLNKDIKNISEITSLFVSEWMEQLAREKLSARSIARRLSAVRSFFAFLVKSSAIEHNPFVLFRAPKPCKKIPTVLGQSEILQLLDNLPEDTILQRRNKCIVYMLYATGIRSEELCNLKIKDISFPSHIMYIMGKGKKERIVPLIPVLEKILKEWLNDRKNIDRGFSQTVFLSHHGRALETSMIRRIIRNLPAGLKEKNLHPHAFRYTFASHLLDCGSNIRHIQELLGHANLGVTQRYTNISIKQLKQKYQIYHPHA